MSPRMPFLANKYMSGSVNNFNLIPDFFNAASHAKPFAEISCAASKFIII